MRAIAEHSFMPGEVEWDSLIGGCDALVAEPLVPGVTRLSERLLSPQSRSYFYLLEGTDADCLIDGGWGFAGSLDRLRRDGAKPLVAVATHSHFDHIGLLHLASLRYGHSAERDVFAKPTPAATQALPFLAGMAAVLDDGRFIRPGSIEQEPCPLDGLVDDGQVLTIGGRTLRILHTPGHSPGSICIVDTVSGLLFCGDTVHDGEIYDAIPGADRIALAQSQQRLVRTDFRRACPGHGAILDQGEFGRCVDRYRRLKQ